MWTRQKSEIEDFDEFLIILKLAAKPDYKKSVWLHHTTPGVFGTLNVMVRVGLKGWSFALFCDNSLWMQTVTD